MIKPNSNNKHTMKKELLFIGLDVHAKSITIALAHLPTSLVPSSSSALAEGARKDPVHAAGGGGGEARLYGTIANDLHALEKVSPNSGKRIPGAELRVCYEAGPTGFVIARRLAPAQYPLHGGGPFAHSHQERERIKTDRRDALKLARLHRAGS